MPSRKRRENAWEPANLAPKDTGSASLSDLFDIGYASTLTLACLARHPSVKARLPNVRFFSQGLGRFRWPDLAQKKSRRYRRLKVITGRRQTEWTGATRCPEVGRPQ